MDKKTKALKLALEWHEWIHSGKSVGYAPCCSNDVMNSIREALAEQPASKPLTDVEIDKLCPQFEDPMRREMWIIGFKAAHGIKGENCG